jgi:hypothetical protein
MSTSRSQSLSDVGQAVPAGVQRLTETAGHLADASGFTTTLRRFLFARIVGPAPCRKLEGRSPAGTACPTRLQIFSA